MNKYSVSQVRNIYTVVVASTESDPDHEYFHVVFGGNRPMCDGDGPNCVANKTCAHTRAVFRYIAKQEQG
jgi:hypothetical protein